MGADFSKYNPPGVFTESVPGPQVGTASSAPRAIGIFGTAVGYRTDFETFVIPLDVPGDPGDPEAIPPVDPTPPTPNPTAVLRQKGIDPTSVVVRDTMTNEIYTLDEDYTVVLNPGLPDGTTDDTATVTRVVGGGLLESTSVQVSYRYTNEEYYNVYSFYDFDDVRDAYGGAFAEDGSIQSELTLACRFAFQNGANQIVAVAVKPTGEVASAADYQTALNKLRNEQGISIVVPATGLQAVHSYVKEHVREQSANMAERRAIVGRDGSTTPVDTTARISNAASLREKRVALASPATVVYFNPEFNQEQVIGGQYLAAALAGRAVAMNPSQPLTRKDLVGFERLPEQLSQSQKSQEAINGLMVVEQTRQGLIRVMHGLTTDPSNIFTKEWSIVGQEDAMAFRLRDYLDNEQLIGTIITDLTMVNVKGSADSALQSLVMDGTIRDYQELKVRQLVEAPDVIEVRFEWRASVPLNFISVKYSVNITSGEIAAGN